MEDILNGELGIGHFRHFLDLKVKKAERVIVKAVVDIIKDTRPGVKFCVSDFRQGQEWRWKAGRILAWIP